MKNIKVDLSEYIVMAASKPQPKVKNKQTGEVALSNGLPVNETELILLPADEDSLDKTESVVVRTVGEMPPIRRGVGVTVTGLVARPWTFVDDSGKERSGITFWAESIAPATAPATAPAAQGKTG